MKMLLRVALFLVMAALPVLPLWDDDMHPHFPPLKVSKRSTGLNKEEAADFWAERARDAVKERVERKLNLHVAKNVIFFLGDGMSIPTISAARVVLGGENQQLAFDKFPYTGLSKTYCVDKQVADSACSATAYLGGVKANYATVGVTAAVKYNDCPSMINSTNHVNSIFHHGQSKGKMTGLVTTARVTHASPAGVYAHTASRHWENDQNVVESNYDAVTCRDIAWQLIHGETGKNLNVVMGGGRANFLPEEVADREGLNGSRLDKHNLIEEWLDMKKQRGLKAEYVWNKEELQKVDFDNTDFLLGLFNADHMNYNRRRGATKEPSLQEMTEAAIKFLQKSKEGYFLFVEGAKIDMAHHSAMAKIALDETLEFSKAIQTAVDLTDESDTLIVVTADHAHTMSYSGYAERGSDVSGIAGTLKDNLPYTILNYANGPGSKPQMQRMLANNLKDENFAYPGIFFMDMETHGGDDVAIFAKGPWAHLFTGVMEENVIPYLITYASCVDKEVNACDTFHKEGDRSHIMVMVPKKS